MKILKLINIVLFIPILLFSETKTLSRKYVPIIIENPDEPLLGMQIRERNLPAEWSSYTWQAFRYNAGNNSWRAVPYQIDEKGNENNYIRQDKWDGILDERDEILFMPATLGDKAPLSAWLDNEQSRKESRIEIEFSDPVNPALKGWVYLYPMNPAIQLSPADTMGYHAYKPGPSSIPAADTAITTAYTVAHDADGWINYLRFHTPDAPDILDRFKFRLAGDPAIGSWVVSEENLKAKENPVNYYYGPIRAFHDERTRLTLPFGLSTNEGDYSWHYFPYSLYIGIDNFPLAQNMIAYFNVNRMRLSIDFNNRAKGMFFYSHRNQGGVRIDGVPDSPERDLDADSQMDWVMATGESGTVIMLLQSDIENVSKKIYYRDAESGGTSDGTDDTGDRRSIGDMGVILRPASGGHFQTRQITFHFLVYFIDQPDMNSAFGDTLIDWVQNPLDFSAERQLYVPSAVHQHRLQPQTFQLHPAYPNPFSPQKNGVHLSFTSQSLHNDAKILIFNVMGQRVARLDPVKSQEQNSCYAVWDGRDKDGERVPAGLYLYRIVQAGFASASGKIVLY
ncbi:hypothetical protein GF407_19310 [candidate division KSB1 bacterium]|nr:hypothetical protein [candidate division KSB1 bacterium]